MPRDWRAVVAVIFATGVMLVLIILAIGETWFADGHTHLTDTESTLLSTTLGAAIGAVATYLGTRNRDDDD